MDKKSSDVDSPRNSSSEDDNNDTYSVPYARNRTRQRNHITFDDDDDDGSQGQTKETKSSADLAPADRRPEWYEDMSEEQINMFKQIFEMLDSDGGGSIDATELYEVFQNLEQDVSVEEIQAVLNDLDKDGKGEIDFDEFLYAMASRQYYDIDSDDCDKEVGAYSKRQTLFFTAITRFAIKNSLGEIERYYANKQRAAPHVISCYTAGARLIGLNDRQLEQEMRRMQKAARNNSSPYAKPLPFVLPKRKSSTKKNSRGKVKSTKKPSTSIDQKQPESQPSPTPSPKSPSTPPPTPPHQSEERHVPKESTVLPQKSSTVSMSSSDGDFSDDIMSDSEIPIRAMARQGIGQVVITPEELEVLKRLAEMAESGNVIARLPGIHLVPQIRNKIVSGDTEAICSSVRKRRRTLEEKIKEKVHANPPAQRGWVIPRIRRGQVPLPVIKLSDANVLKRFTIEDVKNIRKWVSVAMDDYYTALRKALVKTSYRHWDELYIDEIKSDHLRELFCKVYRAYSPQDEENVFAISPWIPGRRFQQPASRKPAGKIHENRLGSCYSAPVYRSGMTHCLLQHRAARSPTARCSRPAVPAASVEIMRVGSSTPTGRSTATCSNTPAGRNPPTSSHIPAVRNSANLSPAGRSASSGSHSPSGRGIAYGSHSPVIRSTVSGSHSPTDKSIVSGRQSPAGRNTSSGSHSPAGRSIASGRQSPASRNTSSGSHSQAGRSIASGSHRPAGRSIPSSRYSPASTNPILNMKPSSRMSLRV